MSVQGQNLNNVIQQYQSQKATIDTELQRLTTELAIMENNLSTQMALAQEKFGTDDINMLNQMLINLTTECDALSTELNNINSGMQMGQVQPNNFQPR